QDAETQLTGRPCREQCEGEPGADPLHRRQQAKPVALDRVDEAVKMNVVFADMRLDKEPRRASRWRQLRDRARRAEDEIADAADIDDGALGDDLIEKTGELRDHRATCHARAVAA